VRKKNNLKRKLKDGQTVLGTWLVSPSSAVANIIAASNFDFLIIDMEHGPASYETAEDLVRAVETEDSTPLIRVPGNYEEMILRGLEVGAHGIIIPQVDSEQGAMKAVQSVKYHPDGQRGLSPFTRSAGYTAKNAENLASEQNAESFVGIIVEGKSGMENLKSIIELQYIDMIYIGIYDLSQSIGFPGEINHPKVQNYLKQCTDQIRSKGIAVGTLANSVEDLRRYKDMGINFIAYKADCAILSEACLQVAEACNINFS